MAPKPFARQVGALIANIRGNDDATEAQLLEAVRAEKLWISADHRIGEADLAKLLGMTPASLANKRREGTAPPAFCLAGGGHRITYRLSDVAKWIESHRELDRAA